MFGNLEKDKKFRYATILYALNGMNGAIVFTYFAYYVIHSIGVRNTLLYMNLGAALGILLIPLYKKIISRVKTYNGAILTVNTVFFIADLLILAAYYFPPYAKAAAFLNTFIETAMGVLYMPFFDGYVMHLYGFQNRAKITSLAQVSTNIAATLILLASYFFYKNTLFTLIITESIRAALILVVLTAPKIEYEKMPEIRRNFSAGGTKVLLIILAALTLQVATTIYGTAKPKIISDTVGSNYISISGAAGKIITSHSQHTTTYYSSRPSRRHSRSYSCTP